MASVTYYPGCLTDIAREHIGKNSQKAQYALDTQIMNDMKVYMPLQTGNFQNLTAARSAALAGTGKVCAATTVYGRYLYQGKKMKNAATGKGPMRIVLDTGETIYRWPKGSKLIPSDEPLQYSTSANPYVEPEWYAAAKRDHFQEWKELVKRRMING